MLGGLRTTWTLIVVYRMRRALNPSLFSRYHPVIVFTLWMEGQDLCGRNDRRFVFMYYRRQGQQSHYGEQLRVSLTLFLRYACFLKMNGLSGNGMRDKSSQEAVSTSRSDDVR